ncbi:MAG: hypothetical protein AB7S26_38755 [Sandaracinaceae bacterium]
MRGPFAGFVLVAAMFVSLSPGQVIAQAGCAEGMAIGEFTEGRCCWPGQRWDDEHGRCSGPPACANGWAARGDECVSVSPQEMPIAPAPDLLETSGATAMLAAPQPSQRVEVDRTGWASSFGGAPTGRIGARIEDGPDVGLVVSGSIVFGVSWITSIVLTEVFSGVGWIAAIPVIGPATQIGFCASSSSPGCGATLVMAPIAAAVEILGLGLLIGGMTAPFRIKVDDSATIGLSLGPRHAMLTSELRL